MAPYCVCPSFTRITYSACLYFFRSLAHACLYACISSFKGDDCHPIVPVMLGDARLATEFADEMLSESVVFF